MNLKKLLSFVFVLMLAATLGYAQTAAQTSSDQTTTTTTKKTKKQKVKDAGSDVKQGTENAASATVSGTKKVASATANGTETAAKKTARTSKNAAGAVTGKGKLDINTATKDQLDALPGIGETYSQKIIDGRPYNAKNDLVRREIIPQSTYDGIKDQIIAHRAAKK
jgi:competence protein ComEA